VDVLRAIVLGAVQGLTEFLPISSSAHLIIIPWLFGWEESGLTFDVALHLGTLVAVLVYFRREIFQIAVAVPRGLIERRPLADPMARLGWIIILGSIPAAIVGFVANDTIDSFFHGGAGGNTAIVLVALLLIALGALLALRVRSWPYAPDQVVSVPASAERLAERGFDQAAVLAAEVARALGSEHRAALVRSRASRVQKGLSRASRAVNAARAFRATGRVRGRVLLVDDVLTTGATAEACAAALTDAGAAEVRVATVARTVRGAAAPRGPR